MELLIFIGLQGAGKTTFYQSRFAATHIHISKDRFRHNRRPQHRQQQIDPAGPRRGAQRGGGQH
jgi:hypothetical protein